MVPTAVLYGMAEGRIRLRRRSLTAIDAGDARGLLDHAFEHVVRLRAAGAAIRRGRHRIGEHAARADVDERDVVHAGQAAREIDGLDVGADRRRYRRPCCRGGGRAARETCRFSSSASSTSVKVSRAWLSLRNASARLDIQCTGRPSLLRRDQHGEIFRIGAGLEAEGAADVLGDARAAAPWARP